MRYLSEKPTCASGALRPSLFRGIAALAPVALLLAACGGGGGAPSGPSPSAAGESAVAAPAAPAASAPDAVNIETAAVSQSPIPGPVANETALPDLPPATASTALPGTTLDAPASEAHPQSIVTTAASDVPVASSDIVYNASAATLSSYDYAALQCQGNNYYWWIWGGSAGRLASPLPDPLNSSVAGAAPAYATVDSPGETNKKAFMFNLRSDDPYTPSTLTNSKRCEINMAWQTYNYPGRTPGTVVGLPRNKNFWWGVSVRVADWTQTADQQIVWQWHDGSSTGFNPLLSMIVKGNQLKLMVAYDTSATPTVATSTTLYPWIGGYTPNSWMKVVVKARVDTVTPANSFATVWINGTQVMDYHGPIGYNVPYTDYAKIGIYHWLNGTNQWDMTVPTRSAWYKGPTQVYDNTGYTMNSVAAIMD